MARLRFPGRPGYRFGRLGVHYGASEPKQECDAGTQLIANMLFGESDEVIMAIISCRSFSGHSLAAGLPSARCKIASTDLSVSALSEIYCYIYIASQT